MTEPWEWDGKFTVGIPTEEGVYYFRLTTPNLAQVVAAVPELIDALANVTDWLSGTEAFSTSHGAHLAVVDAQKLLKRLESST